MTLARRCAEEAPHHTELRRSQRATGGVEDKRHHPVTPRRTKGSFAMPYAQKPPHCGAYLRGAFMNAARFAGVAKYQR